MLDAPAKAHRRSAHPTCPRSVKPEFSPAGLGWVCVAAHSRIGRPQIDTGRGSRLGHGRAGLGLPLANQSNAKKAHYGNAQEATDGKPQTGTRGTGANQVCATCRASHHLGDCAVLAARNQRAKKAMTRPTVGRATTEGTRLRSNALTDVKAGPAMPIRPFAGSASPHFEPDDSSPRDAGQFVRCGLAWSASFS